MSCNFRGSIDDSQGHMPIWESDLSRYFFRPALVHEIKDKLENSFRETFFEGFAPPDMRSSHLVTKQFLDFASLKDPRPFTRGILCTTFFAEKQKNRRVRGRLKLV